MCSPFRSRELQSPTRHRNRACSQQIAHGVLKTRQSVVLPRAKLRLHRDVPRRAPCRTGRFDCPARIACARREWIRANQDAAKARVVCLYNARTATVLARMIRLDKLTKHFGSTYALRGIDLSVPAGQLWGLLGPNGAGKTTLFRILMGIIKPSFGSATIDGLDAFEDRLRVKRILGFLPDEPVFHSYLTGREIISLAGALH